MLLQGCQVSLFADQLVSDLRGCFHASKSTRVRREIMWEKYYKLRLSDEYTQRWMQFLDSSISAQACTIFFQYVTDKIMDKLIKEHFTLPPSSSSTASCSRSPAPLEYNDRNALQYTVGAVVRALQKKVKKGAHPLKESLLLCLNDIQEEGGKFRHFNLRIRVLNFCLGTEVPRHSAGCIGRRRWYA